MPQNVVMSLDAGQMSGLLLVSANRQMGGTIVTRGHIFWRGCPVGKTGPRKAWPRHAGLPLISQAECGKKQRNHQARKIPVQTF